jgi:hypothetical protein
MGPICIFQRLLSTLVQIIHIQLSLLTLNSIFSAVDQADYLWKCEKTTIDTGFGELISGRKIKYYVCCNRFTMYIIFTLRDFPHMTPRKRMGRGWSKFAFCNLKFLLLLLTDSGHRSVATATYKHDMTQRLLSADQFVALH